MEKGTTNYMIRIGLFVLLYTLFHGNTFAQNAADPDPSFNVGGVGAGSDFTGFVNTTALQSDGRIIIGGDFKSYNGNLSRHVARLNPEGTFDNTFVTGSGFDTTVYTTAIQSGDGAVIVGGDFTNYNGTSINGIARLNSDGTLDNTFDPGLGPDSTVRTILILPDGKIMIGGIFATYNGVTVNGIARLNSNGTLDNTFTAEGVGANYEIHTIARQSDGKIIIGGIFDNYTDPMHDGIVLRLEADGELDNTFDLKEGIVGIIFSILIQSDGKIIIAGGFNELYEINSFHNISRLNTDGSIDATFNVTGTGTDGAVAAVALQPDGKIIIGGDLNEFNGNMTPNNIARLTTDGTLDATFNLGPGIDNIFIRTLTLQPDGKIIVGGGFETYQNGAYNNILRLRGDQLNLNTKDKVEHLVKLYPNPSNGLFQLETLEYENDMELRIISIIGAVVFSTPIMEGNFHQINADGMDPGTYVYEIWNNGATYSRGLLQIR